MYHTVLRALCLKIGGADYFSGSVASGDGAWRLTASVLVSRCACPAKSTGNPVAVRTEDGAGPENRSESDARMPDGAPSGDGYRHALTAAGPIVDLVPVWWEFHTMDTVGEVLNDFSFNRMKEGLCCR